MRLRQPCLEGKVEVVRKFLGLIDVSPGERQVVGEAVYGGYFQRPLHVAEEVEMSREVALLEGWDFGHSHPCVVWAQFLPWGALHVLGGVMGVSMFIEDFAPIALQYRTRWFPSPLEILSTGDPAGVAFSPHGVSMSAVGVLRANGVQVDTAHGANSVEQRDIAIQTVAGYMRRLAATGPASFAEAWGFVMQFNEQLEDVNRQDRQPDLRRLV